MSETRAPLDVIQRRTLQTLTMMQLLGGLGVGVGASIGALLAADVSGVDGLSGLPTAFTAFGGAIAAIPLANLADRLGRRWSLSLGNLIASTGIFVVIASAGLRVFPLLLVGFALIGAGNSANLQARFAATDLSEPGHRGRDLSRVVWAMTVGAVLGPNLQGPGEVIASTFAMPHLTGAFVFALATQVSALFILLFRLRPDPLLVARSSRLRAEDDGSAVAEAIDADRPELARWAILVIALSHGVMAGMMAMAPIHLTHHGGDLSVVGLAISLHIGGMYAFAPLFGAMADRFGRGFTIAAGQSQFAFSLVLIWLAGEDPIALIIALVFLGTGWSASTVAGSALVSDASSFQMRRSRQGLSDSLMSATGAVGAIVAGVVLALVGYGNLGALSLIPVVAALVVTVAIGRNESMHAREQ